MSMIVHEYEEYGCMEKCLGLKRLSLGIVIAHERCAEIRKREGELKSRIFASVYAP